MIGSVPEHFRSAINTGQHNDELFFTRFPHRYHRIRPMFEGESDAFAFGLSEGEKNKMPELPADRRYYVVVWRHPEGMAKLIFMANNTLAGDDQCEECCADLFRTILEDK